MHSELRIYRVPETRRYWVVRAEGGMYFDHFNSSGVIALGHLNFMELDNRAETEQPFDWKTLQDNYGRHKEALEVSKKRRTAHLSQVRSFLYDMKSDDWVLTVGNSAVRFGRIVGNPFIDKNPITVVHDLERGITSDMNLHLRRRVEWGPLIARRNLPFGLLISLKANQTLFCLDNKWDAIYHTLYPAFIRGNKLHLSLKIKTHEKIRNHNVASIFKLLDEIEIIGKEFALHNEVYGFERLYNEYIEDDRLTITTKAQFHSPGDIWNAITAATGGINIDRWALYTVLAYSMLFGNKNLGFDGIIDIETRKKMWALILERLKQNRATNVVESLQIELPRIDTSRLEGSNRDSNNQNH